ncbi:hypothetical protein NDU88_001750 [Pleurodeles waltl]|uniref:Uncharacterized protein n=1 Tax=Pleurodeles waltl TaxID=8319 RepID=A0AAV7VXB7_PLEWA|nr:hypothetical protein NDU88_001750 [Pleurodeles waltl]
MDTWVTPKLRRCRRIPPNSRPDQTQAAAERVRVVVMATQCRNNSFTALRSEHISMSGSDTGSVVSSTGSNRTPHVNDEAFQWTPTTSVSSLIMHHGPQCGASP